MHLARAGFLLSIALLPLCLFCAPLAAGTREDTHSSTATGFVLDQDRHPVAGALVHLLNSDGLILDQRTTSPSGAFRFAGRRESGLFVQARTDKRVSGLARLEGNGPVELTLALAPSNSMTGVKPPASRASRETEVADLHDQLAAMAEQIERLQRRLAELEGNDSVPEPVAQPEAIAAATLPVQDSESIYGTRPSGGNGPDAGQKIQVGGYGSFRYEANSIGPTPPIGLHPQVPNSYNSFDFRRFVMTLDANPTPRLRFYTEIEFERLGEIEVERTAIAENRGTRDRAGVRFIQEVEGQAGSELAMEQAWAQFDFNDHLSARMGVVLPPLGRFNTNHDDNEWEVSRRSLVDRGGPVLPVKSAWSELGAGLLGKTPVGEGFLDYQFFVVNGATLDFAIEEVASLREGRNLVELEPEISFSSGPFNGTNTADAYTWRLGYAPRVGHEIALSGYHGEYTPDYLLEDAWIHAVGIDGITSFGNFEIEGEFVYSDFGRMETVLNDLARQAVDAAAATSSLETATLETEIEAGLSGPMTNQRYGYWIDLKYSFWPRALNDSFLGRGFESPEFVPIVRFERIWFNDFVRSFDFAGGTITDLTTETLSQQRTTVGFAYKPTPAVGFTIAWENNRRMEGSTLIFPSTMGIGRVPDKNTNGLVIGSVFGF